MFFDHTRQQLVLELAARPPIRAEVGGGSRSAIAARSQAAVGRRFVLVAELAGSYDFESAQSDAAARLEPVVKR